MPSVWLDWREGETLLWSRGTLIGFLKECQRLNFNQETLTA
jgi:hypothetical protein